MISFISIEPDSRFWDFVLFKTFKLQTSNKLAAAKPSPEDNELLKDYGGRGRHTVSQAASLSILGVIQESMRGLGHQSGNKFFYPFERIPKTSFISGNSAEG